MTTPTRPEHGHGYLVARIREIDWELEVGKPWLGDAQATVHSHVAGIRAFYKIPSTHAGLIERRAALQAELEAVEAYLAATPGTPAFIVSQASPNSTIRRDKDGKLLGIDIEPLPPGKEWEVVPVRLICPLTDKTVRIRYPDSKLEIECYAAHVFKTASEAEADIPNAAKRLDDLLASFGPEFDAACIEIAKTIR